MMCGRRALEPRPLQRAWPAADATDRQLLERFVAKRDEAAFALLVQRHGPQVLRIGRRVLGDEQAAEDVFQAAFLVLARKASTVAWHESIGGWIQAVAHRLARHARCAARRSGLLCATSAPDLDTDLPERSPSDPAAELARRELTRVLAEELHRLPEKYRAPVVLCYLEGKTNEEAARQLGWPSGSMSRRLAHARLLLRESLTRRGLAILLVVVCAAMWLRGRDHPVRSAVVAARMQPFKAAAAGGQDIEHVLTSLAGGAELDVDADRVAQMADQTAAVAEQLRDHDPGRHPAAWRQLSEQMRRAAVDLSSAVAVHDERTTLAAARRLTATCQQCHAVFRD